MTDLSLLSASFNEKRSFSTITTTLTVNGKTNRYELLLEERVNVRNEEYTLSNTTYQEGDSKSIHRLISSLYAEHKISHYTARLLVRFIRISIQLMEEAKKHHV